MSEKEYLKKFKKLVKILVSIKNADKEKTKELINIILLLLN